MSPVPEPLRKVRGIASSVFGVASAIEATGGPVLDGTGKPDARLVFFPAGDAQIIETWNVVGLQGTGSHDFAVTDLDVSPDHAMAFAFRPWPAGVLWRMPPMALFFAP